MAAKKESSSKQLPTGPAGDKKAALETALAQIEKQFGKGAVMKLGTNVAMQVDAISTGSLGLDLALGIGGLPRGRIIEVYGPESSGKTTLLNALKETLPDDMAILVAQQADELTTLFHPDMMFLHSLPGTSESSVNYDLKHISIAGLTMDVDFFIIGEVKGGEALYLLNAAYTGQICAATVHAPSADRAPEKIVDYAMYDSRYSRNELMKMMDCFQTLVFMEHYRVKEIFACLGWNAEKENLEYERLF